MKCDHCDREHSRRRFCSEFCKNEWHKEQKRIKNRERNDSTILKCEFCASDFIPFRQDQKFCCNECKVDLHREEQKRLREERRRNIIRTCPICSEQFSPKYSLREIYCSPRCRNLVAKKVYKMMQTCYEQVGTKKADRSHAVLGYTPKELLAHIQSHENWNKVKDGPWHLDHRFPIIAFVRRGIKDIALICCLENLQPLSGPENCSKNDSYDEVEFEKWISDRCFVNSSSSS